MSILVQDLSFRYLDEKEKVIKNINLNVQQGEFILLTGPTGCGKSTLLKCFNGLIPHHHPGYISGAVLVNGMDTKNVSVFEVAPSVGLVFQNPDDQLISFTVEKELAFGLENLGTPQAEMQAKIHEIMELLKLNSLKDHAPQDLSGGQQQLVAIGSVLIFNPLMICLDEPSSNLDPSVTCKIFQILHDLNQKYSLTIIVVEHRLDLLLPYITRILVMNDGDLIYDGNPREILLKDDLVDIGINIPFTIRLYKRLKKEGIKIDQVPKCIDETMTLIKKMKEEYK
ncbi:MAG: energy-coupling factor ABC transporter ATP-binding protein [Candidatus Helarchaeota archaeon]